MPGDCPAPRTPPFLILLLILFLILFLIMLMLLIMIGSGKAIEVQPLHKATAWQAIAPTSFSFL